MRDRFDRRVFTEPFLGLVRSCQRQAPCHLAGGAALSGVYLGHRMTGDLDLFCHSHADFQVLRHGLTALAQEAGFDIRVVRDSGTFTRCLASTASGESIELDIVEELLPDIEPPPPPVEGIIVESLADLRAAKLTCLLSRSEPRDLADLLFLERAGHPPEADLPLALQKDAGIDPGVLAWLLADFPCHPLPRMILPLTEDELRFYRDDLARRFRRLAVPPD